MDNVIDDLAIIERRLENASQRFAEEPIKALMNRVVEAADSVGEAWSGSYLGYHAHVYYVGLRRPAPGDGFDPNRGLMTDMWSGPPANWREFDPKAIGAEVYRRAGLPQDQPLEPLFKVSKEIEEVFDNSKDELLATLDAALASARGDERLKELREEVKKVQSHISQDDLFGSMIPRGNHYSQDMRALQGRIQCPMHIAIKTNVWERFSYGASATQLAKLARSARLYMAKRLKMGGTSVARTDGKIFIGHGRSPAWLLLDKFLRETLGLQTDEFESLSPAGLSHTERLQQMMDGACFAFLVMTGDEEHADGTKHARESVIHEVGLFQGRLGFKRAIVMLEEGCQEFLNIVGHGQIRFPKGDIRARFEEVRKVLQREKIIP